MDEAALARVFDAGEDLLGDRGFYRVTLAEVAERAGVDTGEVEAEFADSGALLLRIVQVRAHEMRAHLHKAVTGLTSRSMMEGAGFQAFFEWIAAHPKVYRVVRQAEVLDEPVYRHWYADLASDYVRGLTQAMDEGEIARGDPETLAYCLMGMGDFLGMRYVLWDGKPSVPAEVLKTFQRIWSRAMLGR